MNKPKLKLIAYWNQYKKVLRWVPVEQEYYISEYKYENWKDGKVVESGFKYERYKLDWMNDMWLKVINRDTLDRQSLELYDYLVWKKRKMGYK